MIYIKEEDIDKVFLRISDNSINIKNNFSKEDMEINNKNYTLTIDIDSQKYKDNKILFDAIIRFKSDDGQDIFRVINKNVIISIIPKDKEKYDTIIAEVNKNRGFGTIGNKYPLFDFGKDRYNYDSYSYPDYNDNYYGYGHINSNSEKIFYDRLHKELGIKVILDQYGVITKYTFDNEANIKITTVEQLDNISDKISKMLDDIVKAEKDDSYIQNIGKNKTFLHTDYDNLFEVARDMYNDVMVFIDSIRETYGILSGNLAAIDNNIILSMEECNIREKIESIYKIHKIICGDVDSSRKEVVDGDKNSKNPKKRWGF